MKWWKNLHWKTRQRLKAFLGAAALTPFISLLDLPAIEAPLYDLWSRSISRLSPSTDIVLVAVDDASAMDDEFLPLAMNRHAELLEALVAAQPTEIGLLVDYRAVEQVDPAVFSSQIPRFVKAVHTAQNKGISVLLGTPFDVSGEVLPPKELSGLPRAVGILHRDGNVFAKDDVARRALLRLYGKPTFHARVAGTSHLDGEFDVPELDARFAFFSYSGNPENLPYVMVSARDILNPSLADAKKVNLRGKTILLGSLSKHQPNDFVRTPFSREADASPRLVVHAQIIDALKQHSSIKIVPGSIQIALIFLALLGTIGVVLVRAPLMSASLALGICAVTLLITAAAFWSGVWILASQILLGIGIGYYVAVPFRLWTEYQTRFDYQRKHEILTQVEQLKSNFMSLVTHDLKTPVARIQGLAETLISRLGGAIGAPDMEGLKRITVATDDLNKFISSILELAQIESNQIRLAPESKDINKLVEKTVSDFREVARGKGQILATKLEPLFPVRVDPGLLTRVFGNLVDNAIKYSPVGSQITVESRESGDWIEVRVKDEGRALSEDEQRSLFTKFHRIKREGELTPGTGLGLYLSKYFVEAHRGQLDVESGGPGNTFVVRIPLRANSPSRGRKFEEVGHV